MANNFISIDFQDLQKAINGLKISQRDIDNAIDQAVVDTAVTIQRETIQKVNETTQGSKIAPYRRNKKKVYVSPKGGAPNTQSGDLVGSIQVAHFNGSGEAMVFSDLEYAFELEYERDRPFLMPTLISNEPVFFKNLQNEINRKV